MNFKEAVKLILTMVVPYLKEFIESKIIPVIVRKSYERFDDLSNDMIERLVHLLDKINNTENDKKREAHLFGFNLGIKTLKKVADKLTEACAVLEKELRTIVNDNNA